MKPLYCEISPIHDIYLNDNSMDNQVQIVENQGIIIYKVLTLLG